MSRFAKSSHRYLKGQGPSPKIAVALPMRSAVHSFYARDDLEKNSFSLTSAKPSFLAFDRLLFQGPPANSTNRKEAEVGSRAKSFRSSKVRCADSLLYICSSLNLTLFTDSPLNFPSSGEKSAVHPSRFSRTNISALLPGHSDSTSA